MTAPLTYRWRYFTGTGEMRTPDLDIEYTDKGECGMAAQTEVVRLIKAGGERPYRYETYHTGCKETLFNCECEW